MASIEGVANDIPTETVSAWARMFVAKCYKNAWIMCNSIDCIQFNTELITQNKRSVLDKECKQTELSTKLTYDQGLYQGLYGRFLTHQKI